MSSVLGVREWRPRLKGQKGLRILCLDGGGTRGVCTIGVSLVKLLTRTEHFAHLAYTPLPLMVVLPCFHTLFSSSKRSEGKFLLFSVLLRVFISLAH